MPLAVCSCGKQTSTSTSLFEDFDVKCCEEMGRTTIHGLNPYVIDE
jgi:hypothetical protein